MEYLFKGGDTTDPANYEQESLPVRANGDIVVFDQTTTDIICHQMPDWYGLKMTNFKANIYYIFSDLQLSGMFLNEDRYNLFSYISHIQRID